MEPIVVVHGAGGPPRGTESLRSEWLTSMQDGLVLAGHPVPEMELSIVDLDERPAPPGDGLDPGPLDWPTDGWQLATLAAWRAHAVYDAGEPACDAARPATVLSALSWSRYFAGLPAADLAAALDELDSYRRVDARAARAAARVREAVRAGTRTVLAFGMGGLAALHALSGDPAGVQTLVTIGTPVGLNPAQWRGCPVPEWWHLVDPADTLVAASPPAQVVGRQDVFLDCDPRLRAPRNYLASPEFGEILATVQSGALNR